MSAVTVTSSPPARRAYSESHPRHPFRSPLGHVTHRIPSHVAPPTKESLGAKLSIEELRYHLETRGEREREKGEGETKAEEKEGGREGSGESTAEEVDVAPNESSTTTDTLPEPSEPVDFIECGTNIPRAYSTSSVPHIGHGHDHRVMGTTGLQGYENWSILVQMHQHGGHGGVKKAMGAGSRGSLQRRGKVMRGGMKERQRLPHPLPRPSKLKNQHTRPVPVSRKRRFSGRLTRPSHSVSEGDMAMADEMGEGEGEGGDDGFVDCVGGEPAKRRSKKRGGLHMLIPAMGTGNTSPPSSPSNTPVSRRRTSSRKSRPKPRTRKSTKQHKPASADISTQETTTPGPNSSDTTDDTDSHDESHPGLGGGDTCDHNGLAEDRRSHSGTPNLLFVSSESSSHLGSGSEASGALEYSSALEDGIEADTTKKDNISTNSFTSATDERVPENGVSVSKFHSEENLHRDSNETSDTDRTSLHVDQCSYSVQRKLRVPWSGRKLDSDFSTAPLSSETSDMDTSGNEKILTDGGSTSDLTSISQDSRNEVGEVFASPLQPHSGCVSGGARPGSAESGNSKKKNAKTLPQKYAISKKPVTGTASPPVTKRPLKASLSSPLKTDGRASPKPPTSAGAKNTVALKAPPRPKPPIAAKPAKPEVKSKPRDLTSTRSGSASPPQQRKKLLQTKVSSDSDSVDFASERSKAIVSTLGKPEPRVPSIGSPKAPRHAVRKASSDSNLTASETVTKPPSSPTFVPRKLSNVREESEDKDSDTEKAKPRRISPPLRQQLLPTKPKPRPTAMRKVSPTPPPKPSGTPKTPPPTRKASANDDAPSASESGHSSSPHTPKRKPVPPQKPSLPLKKPNLFQQTVSAGAIQTPSSTSTVSPSPNRKLSSNGEKESTPPAKPPTKRRQYSREISLTSAQSVSPTLTPSASPTPPLLPPRSPILQRRESEIAISSGCLSVQGISRNASSSSLEDVPPVPLRKAERKSLLLSEATSPVTAANLVPSLESGRQTPPPVKKIRTLHRVETSPPTKKPKTPPRRPPPTPPLSPSPPPVPSHSKTIGRSSIAETRTADPLSPKRHSLFSSDLSNRQISDISQVYDVLDNVSEQNKELERLYRQSASSVADSEAQKKLDTEQDSATSTATTNRKPRRHYTHYELTFLDSTEPPRLIKNPSESSIASQMSSDDVPPPLPSQPIPKKKDRQQTLLKRGPIKNRDSTSPPSQKSDEGIKSDTQSVSSECSVWSHTASKERVYDVISDKTNRTKRSRSPSIFKRLTHSDSKETDKSTGSVSSPESPFRRETKSFSSFMFRRSNSDRFKKNKIKPVVTGKAFTMARQAVHRTPSVDKLDDRMERSVRLSAEVEDESSSDEEETSVSPTQQGLPQLPFPRYTETPKAQKKRVERSASAYVVPTDEEPLYQYINTAEFLRTPQENVRTGLTKNQLDIARQLSHRRLWCEQPEIIKSGVLESLTEEEKKLQEAIFEVVTTEATYLRSLDVLIDHFMEDAGMNPNLPEGRRVLEKRQHHVIFSNVKEVREISARFLEELRVRQKETAAIKGIADIILEYAEKKFDCYVRYCTNQIYQTRDLQECLEKNPMFREYLRRLERHKTCQNLSMLSFLLLPMQRITRLPLLILAILNKTPLDHPHHSTVETCLRTVQKLVTECNDGARKMERTEQLHNIHKQLDFGKLKPFPLVSVSRQLERKGTVVRLRVEQKLFSRHQIKRKQMYLFVFTDLVIITKRKKDPKGEYVYKVIDYSSRAVVEMEDIGVHPGVTFPKHTFGEQDTVANATWAVSTAGEKHAFLLILLDNVNRHSEKYIFVAQNDTDKARWLESLATPESQREDEKIYQHWDCPQVQAIYDYKACQPDELALERGDVVKVFRKMADGWYEGERLRDLQWGWFPSNFTTEVVNEHTRARNLRETHRLLSLPYSPEEYIAKMATIR